MDKQVKQIIKALIKKSKKNEVVWRREGYNKFSVSLSMGTISIESGSDWICYPCYDVAVFNHKDEPVFDGCADKRTGGSHFYLLQELYRCARESSLGIRQLYESMLRTIVNSDIVGSKGD